MKRDLDEANYGVCAANPDEDEFVSRVGFKKYYDVVMPAGGLPAYAPR